MNIARDIICNAVSKHLKTDCSAVDKFPNNVPNVLSGIYKAQSS